MPDITETQRGDLTSFDIVDRTSAQSFPASDPPGWALGRLHRTAPTDPATPSERRPLQTHDEDPSASDPELAGDSHQRS